MIHPDTELRWVDEAIGHGVFAVRLIPKGSITWALDYLDHVIEPDRVRELPPAYQPIIDRYAFYDSQGRHVLCWDHGRYVNHACDASSLPLGSVCEIAVRDILPGEQVTSDYVTLNLVEEITCRCGLPRCRGLMRPTDLPLYVKEIDAKVGALVPSLLRVQQPLIPYMVAADRARFEAIAKGQVEAPSCVEVSSRG